MIDVSNPIAPYEVDNFDTAPGYAQGVTVIQGNAYVANEDWGLFIIDVSNPTVGLNFVGGIDTPGQAINVTVVGDYAYVADWGSLRIIYIGNPNTPVEVEFYNVQCTDVTVKGKYAYITGTSGFYILDLWP